MLKILSVLAGIAGILLLVLLLLLLLLLALLLLPRVFVEADKTASGPLRLTVGYGILRIPLLPRPKREKKPEAPPAPKEPPAKRRRTPAFSLEGIDLGDTICLALELLLELRNRLVIRRLRVDVVIASGDAAKTGILLGQSAAITGMILPFLEQNFVIRDFHIDVDGDFQAEVPATRSAFGVTVSLRLFHLPLLLLKYRKPLLALLRALRADAGAGEEEETAAASDHATKKENAS